MPQSETTPATEPAPLPQASAASVTPPAAGAATHTPGDWTATESDTTPGFWSITAYRAPFDGADVAYLTLRPSVERAANARLMAAAPRLYGAGHFARTALAALEAFEADHSDRLPDDFELGRIPESEGSPSFRLRVGHIRLLAAAIAKAEGRDHG